MFVFSPLQPAQDKPTIAENVPGRLLCLDVFRAIAALAVVLYHFTLLYGDKIGHPDGVVAGLTYGFYGVQFFFVISGFVIFLTLQRTRHPLDFVVSRVTRIYPLYCVAVVLAFLILSFSSLPFEQPGIAQFIANFTLIQQYYGFAPLDGVYWSLVVELIFYVWMFLLFVTKQLHRVIWFSWAWLGLIWMAQLIQASTGYFSWFIREFFILNYAHLFIAGIIFYRAYESGWNKGELLLLFLCWITEFLVGGWQGLAIVASFFGAFILFVNGKLGWIAGKPLVFLGSISYALYLVHQNLGYTVMKFLYGYGLSMPVVVAAAVAVSVLVAALLTYYIEQPVLKWLRKVYSGWKCRRGDSMRCNPSSAPTP